MPKTYTVEWRASGIVCTVTEHNTTKEINPRLDLTDYGKMTSTGRFSINFHDQLALALLADCFGNDDDRAVELHQWFKNEFISTQTGSTWTITSDEILLIVSRY